MTMVASRARFSARGWKTLYLGVVETGGRVLTGSALVPHDLNTKVRSGRRPRNPARTAAAIGDGAGAEGQHHKTRTVLLRTTALGAALP
jgi:hypothetical protein